MKIEKEYPLEEYKDKFPFPIPQKIYRLDIDLGIDASNNYQELEVVGFIVQTDDWDKGEWRKKTFISPLIKKDGSYYTLYERYSGGKEYYTDKQEARDNFNRCCKDIGCSLLHCFCQEREDFCGCEYFDKESEDCCVPSWNICIEKHKDNPDDVSLIDDLLYASEF